MLKGSEPYYSFLKAYLVIYSTDELIIELIRDNLVSS